jgi:uncharacterized protein YecE (DUF72 family)
VRNDSFKDKRFYDLCRKHNVAIVFAHDPDFPEIDEPTADFTYARLMGAEEKGEDRLQAGRTRQVGEEGQGLGQEGRRLHLLHLGAKVRNPAAAQALIEL